MALDVRDPQPVRCRRSEVAVDEVSGTLEAFVADRGDRPGAAATVAGQTAVSGHHGTVNGEPTIFWAPFTQAANLTRHPAGSVCVGLTADGMPVGIQVTGAHAADAALLDVLAGIEGLVGTPTWPVEA